MAPEVIREEVLSSKSDMWSTGVMIYAMLVAYPPFHSLLGMEATYDLIKSTEYDFPEEDWDRISDEAKDLIEKLLVPVPERRLTAGEALNHPWIMKNIEPSVLKSEYFSNIEVLLTPLTPFQRLNLSIMGHLITLAD